MKRVAPKKSRAAVTWTGEIAEVIPILERPGLNRAARPMSRLLATVVGRDTFFKDAVAEGAKRKMEGRLTFLVLRLLRPGILPRNTPGTTARKGGDFRALRRPTHKDRIFRGFRPRSWTV